MPCICVVLNKFFIHSGREGDRWLAVSCEHLSQHPEYASGLIPENTGAFTGCSPICQPSVAASIVCAQGFSQTQSSGDPGYKTSPTSKLLKEIMLALWLKNKQARQQTFILLLQFKGFFLIFIYFFIIYIFFILIGG